MSGRLRLLLFRGTVRTYTFPLRFRVTQRFCSRWGDCTDSEEDVSERGEGNSDPGLVDNLPLENESVEPSPIRRDFVGSIDSLFSQGIDGISSTIDFTSKTVNSTIREGEKLTTDLIKDSTELLQSVTPQLVHKDTKILPESIEQTLNSSATYSKGATKYLRDGVGTITGYGAILGASAFNMLPFQPKESENNSASLKALGRLVRTTAGAVKETMETTDSTTSRLTDAGIQATESLSSHVLGQQSGKMLGTSLRAGKDLVDTVNSTRKLNMKKLSVKFTKKARDGILSELAEKNKQPGASPRAITSSPGPLTTPPLLASEKPEEISVPPSKKTSVHKRHE